MHRPCPANTNTVDAIEFNHNPASGSPPPTYGDDVLINTLMGLKRQYRRRAIWVMNSGTLATIRKFHDSNGQPIWQPSLGAGIDGNDGVLLGKRVVVDEDIPNVATDAFPVLCGDFTRAYELIRIHGMKVTVDEVTNIGFIRFWIRQRFGGNVVDNDAVKAVKTGVS